jgi:hypothetical protein
VAPSYADLDRRVYEELEARVEETVRAALYGETSPARKAPDGAARAEHTAALMWQSCRPLRGSPSA